MKDFLCQCGETLYFENTSCSACGCVVGWCDLCNSLRAMVGEGPYGCSTCSSALIACANRIHHTICNGLVAAPKGGNERIPGLCRRCCSTIVTPDKRDAEAISRWGVLEAGKRLLLYGLDSLGLDWAWREGEPALRFRFVADTAGKKVVTGHAAGVITINLQEADPVHREIARRDFGEPQRTVIGHLRHEFGHYLQLRLFGDQPGPEVVTLFGDPAAIPYPDALKAYYANGPRADWREQHISAYASAHPWEDFAETASFYLDMMAVLDTLVSHQAILQSFPNTFDEALQSYQTAAFVLNEVNRSMGLTDLVPYVVSEPVAAKLKCISDGVQNAGN